MELRSGVVAGEEARHAGLGLALCPAWLLPLGHWEV